MGVPAARAAACIVVFAYLGLYAVAECAAAPPAGRPGDAGPKPTVAPAAPECADADLRPSPATAPEAIAAIVCLMNVERAASGLAPLRWNWQLYGAAQGMASRMVERCFFSHVEPDGTRLLARIDPTGYLPHRGDRWALGENLGWGQGLLGTPRAMVTGWMASPEHRANVLAPDYRDVGVGFADGSPVAGNGGGSVYAAEFGLSEEAAADVQSHRGAKPAGRHSRLTGRRRRSRPQRAHR